MYANGRIDYAVRGVHARVSVVWNYEAPPGAGDTHYSLMRGTRASLVIRQGEEQAFTPDAVRRAARDDGPFGVGIRGLRRR